MSARRSRWLLFAFLFLAVPFATPGPFGAFAPPLHYAMLFLAGVAIALVEGAQGPVPMIVGMLGLFAVATGGLALAVAWFAGRLVERLPRRLRAPLVWGAVSLWLAIALLFDVYRTPLGPTQHTNLIGLVW